MHAQQAPQPSQPSGGNGTANGAGNGNGAHVGGRHQAPSGSTQPDYGAPAGWHAPGWPPPQQHQQPGHWYPPPQGWAPPQHGQPPQPQQPQQPQQPHQAYPTPSGPTSKDAPGDEAGRPTRPS